MKNVSVILNVVLLAAVIVLYALHFTKGEKSSSNNKPASGAEKVVDSLQEQTLKVAYVNIDTVLSEYKLYQEMQDIFKEKQQRMQANLQSRSRNFEQKMAEFRNKVQKRLITSAQAKDQQKKLTREQQNLMEQQKQMQNELAQHEQSMMQQVYDSLQSYLKNYNKNRSYDIIFSNTYTSTLLYGKPKMNITMDVLNGINNRYARAKNDEEE